jgi:hypothetical protein
MATAAYQFAAGTTFGGKSDNTGNWGRTAAAFKPEDPLWVAQATAGTIAGAAGTRRAAIEAAAQLTGTGVQVAGSVLNQGTAGLSSVAAQGVASHGAIVTQGMQGQQLQKATQRKAGDKLLGLGLMGLGGLVEFTRKPAPLPQRRTVEKPSYLTFEDAAPAKA